MNQLPGAKAQPKPARAAPLRRLRQSAGRSAHERVPVPCSSRAAAAGPKCRQRGGGGGARHGHPPPQQQQQQQRGAGKQRRRAAGQARGGRAARCCRAGRDRWQVLRAGLPTRLRASSAKFAGGRRRKPRRDCSSRAGDVADQPPLSGGAAATPLNPRWPPARPPGRLFLRGLKGPSRPPLRGSPLPGVRSGSSEFCPLLPPGLRRAVLPRSQLRRCRPPAPRRPGGSVPAAPAASTAA